MKNIILLLLLPLLTFGQDTTKRPIVADISAQYWFNIQQDINQVANERNYYRSELYKLKDSLNNPIYAVNIHPFTSPVYADFAKVYAHLKQAGFNAARVDVKIGNDIQKLKVSMPDITLLPMWTIPDLNMGYNAGVTYGKQIATYGFEYNEIGNEIDVQVIKTGSGTKLTDYDTLKIKQASQTIKGIADGIHSVGLKTIVDCGWSHQFFINYLLNTGVKIDVIAQHWYLGQQKAWKGLPIEKYIEQQYPKGIKIVFNEIGLDNTGQISDIDINKFSEMYNTIKGKYPIWGFYELESQQGRKGKEAYFGIYDFNNDIKPFFKLIK